MKITVCTLVSNYKILLLEDVFPQGLLEDFTKLCHSSEDLDNDWSIADYNDKRKIYTGNSDTYQLAIDYLSSNQFMQPIENTIVKSMSLVDSFSLWADYPGFGKLKPHVEKTGQGQGQLFITTKEHPTNGTTIMNNNKEILFTMPYRNNFGWYMEDCTQIMHSRQFDTPPNYVRYSLIFWHNYNER